MKNPDKAKVLSFYMEAKLSYSYRLSTRHKPNNKKCWHVYNSYICLGEGRTRRSAWRNARKNCSYYLDK